MTEKQCFKCGEVKPLSDFYKHSQMADGHVNKCKECNKKDVRENRKNRSDYYRDYESRRARQPHRVEARMLYAITTQGKESRRRAGQKYQESNPIKRAAQIMVGNAVRDGRLNKPDRCSECGATPKNLHGHHDDYAKPLNVRWLCPMCHKKWHQQNGEGANAT